MSEIPPENGDASPMSGRDYSADGLLEPSTNGRQSVRRKNWRARRSRTPDLLLRRSAVQNSKCRLWCRLRANASLILPSNRTEIGLKIWDKPLTPDPVRFFCMDQARPFREHSFMTAHERKLYKMKSANMLAKPITSKYGVIWEVPFSELTTAPNTPATRSPGQPNAIPNVASLANMEFGGVTNNKPKLRAHATLIKPPLISDHLTCFFTLSATSRERRVAEALHEARSLVNIQRMIPSRQLTLWYFALAGALRSVGERGAFRFVHAQAPETHLRLRPSALYHFQLLPPASSSCVAAFTKCICARSGSSSDRPET